MIEISGLTKRFGDLTAVDNLNLRVEKGEVLGFLGPNGAGKTTTVKIMSGLMYPTAGSVKLCGIDIVQNPVEAKRITALVPDEPFVYPKLSGVEFLHFTGDLYGVPADEQERRIPELLEMFDLVPWQSELLESYSHGMRQKLVIATMLLRKPKVVLLDEPMVGLDPKSARMVKTIIRDLAAAGATVFMCTHILEIAEKLCDRIGIMYGGKMIELGTMATLRAKTSQGLDAGDGRRISLEDVFLDLTSDRQFSSL
jgi:ABC-2 type transport system ATP-binding protein